MIRYTWYIPQRSADGLVALAIAARHSIVQGTVRAFGGCTVTSGTAYYAGDGGGREYLLLEAFGGDGRDAIGPPGTPDEIASTHARRSAEIAGLGTVTWTWSHVWAGHAVAARGARGDSVSSVRGDGRYRRHPARRLPRERVRRVSERKEPL